jgi:hypothetical protein
MMNKFCALILFAVFIVRSLFADEEMAPHLWMMVSNNQKHCFRMVPEKHHFEGKEKVVDRRAFGIANTLDENGEMQEIWRVEGWYAFSGHLSDNGRYFVRMGPWATDLENHTDLAVAFYDHGKLLKEYRVKDLIKNDNMLEESVSHYQWLPVKQTRPTGFVNQWNSNLFHLVMIDHTTYDFDFTTGTISATGLDKRALSSDEMRSLGMAKEAKRGMDLLHSSAEEKPLKALFEINEVRFSNSGKTVGVYFEEKEWSVKLTPKTPLKYPSEVHAIHPVTTDGKLLIGVTADQLIAALKIIVAHPYVEDRFKAHAATGIRVRVAGDRLHWDTEELKEIIKLFKTENHSLENLKLCVEVIIDEPGHVYHSFFLNTHTGQIIREE